MITKHYPQIIYCCLNYIKLSCNDSSFFSIRIRAHQHNIAKTYESNDQYKPYVTADRREAFQGILQYTNSIGYLFTYNIQETDENS